LARFYYFRKCLLAQEGGRRESNPHNPGSQPGLAAALSSATVLQPGLEPGTRPSQSRVMSLSPSKQTVPRPGVEPGPAPSEGAMMSLSPPGQQRAVTREGLEPSRHGGHGLLRTACLPFHHLAILCSGPGRALNPRWPGAGQPSSRSMTRPSTSGPAGSRTLNLDFKRVLLCRLSYKAVVQCVGQELNLHSSRGWVTATWARRCPADTSFSTLDGI
jgi:hypothetical protein